MPRAIWKGAISFGLVNIPVELHTAVRDHRPKFRMLHATDKSPVKFTRVCIRDGHPVAWEDLVKGYEYAKGHFAVLTKEDFEAAAVEKTRRVDIIDFVKADEIDDRYFETPYYLVPGRGGDHAYALLREALRQEERVGIAKFIMRDTQHLAAVEVIGQALVLTLMRFSDELVDSKPLELPHARDVRKPELDMAKALVNNLASEWDPAKYTDEYRENLMRVIKAKVKGKKVKLTAQEEPREGKVVDLMERLRQSLAAHEGASQKSARKPARSSAQRSRPARRKTARRTKRARRAA